jgi:hypothetical protein
MFVARSLPKVVLVVFLATIAVPLTSCHQEDGSVVRACANYKLAIESSDQPTEYWQHIRAARVDVNTSVSDAGAKGRHLDRMIKALDVLLKQKSDLHGRIPAEFKDPAVEDVCN